MKKLAMFDMDGVLFDTMPLHVKSWRQIVLNLTGKEYPPEFFYANEGRNCFGTISAIFGEEKAKTIDCDALYLKKTEIFNTLGPIETIPNAIDVIKALKERGMKAIVVTGSANPQLIQRIEGSYPGLFDLEYTISSKDVIHGKPAPEPYLKGLEKAGGYAVEDAVVIENSPLGVRAGHLSGCYTIAVNTGPLPDKVLLDEGADILFHSMSELLEAISNNRINLD